MVMPYLAFSGRCEEAFEHYKKAFGGEIQQISRYGDMPEDPENPVDEGLRKKVMHGQMKLGEYGYLSGADATWPVDSGSAVSIFVMMEDGDSAQRAMDILAEEGDVLGELQANPPPDQDSMSGAVRDKFGFTWTIAAMV